MRKLSRQRKQTRHKYRNLVISSMLGVSMLGEEEGVNIEVMGGRVSIAVLIWREME